MLVLGIDPGTAITGYAIVGEGEDAPYLVDAGVLRTESTEPVGARLQAIYRGVAALARQHRPDAAAVEEVFFSRNVRTALAVGHARGVVLLALADCGVPVYEYKPTQVKGTITGYGAADKQQMQEMVRLLLHLEHRLEPDDAADAAAIAMCHMQTAAFMRAVEGQGKAGPR
ncbi:MAG: crossover junction endodeoxyribonuclease RuvC [Anaerolineae bacterium]